MEMINARKKVIDMMEEYNSSSDLSLEEKLKSVGLDGKEDPPDFF